MLKEQGREATSVFAGLFRYLDEVLEYTKVALKMKILLLVVLLVEQN